MKLSTKKISSTEAADIYLRWIDEKQVEAIFGSSGSTSPQATWDRYLIGLFSKFVPLQTGMLMHSATLATKVGSGEIIYNTPYARFLYYGKVMVDPKTGSPWARSGVSKVVIDRDLTFSGEPTRGAFWDRRAMFEKRTEAEKFYKGIITDVLQGGGRFG